MPNIEFLIKCHLGKTNLVIRLTPSDTKFLHQRVHDAMVNGKGVNFILHQMDGALNLVRSDNRGYEMSLSNWASSISHRVESPQEGYTGGKGELGIPWSHFEVYFEPVEGEKTMRRFLKEVVASNQGRLL